MWEMSNEGIIKGELKEYSVSTPESIKKMATSIAQILNIMIDTKEIDKVMNNNGKIGEDCIAYFYNSLDPETFILVDCQNNDILYEIHVRCRENVHFEVKNTLLHWENKVREEYGQEPAIDLNNEYLNPDSSLKKCIKKHKLDYLI